MKKVVLLLFLTWISMETIGQQQGSFDMVVLRDVNGRTIKSYFQGIPIVFGTTSGRYVEGTIRKIERDSIFVQKYDVRRAMTMWGTQVQDTVGIFWTAYHTNEVSWIRKPKAKFEFVRDGTIFMIGGTAYAALHVFNAAYLGEPVVWSTVGISMGIAAAGFVMHKLRKRKYTIGHGYILKYINTEAQR
ncbi:MAG TPA: hypothetical protein VLA58_05865 [Chitinophagaceae bacterium]|nr:hypothetical protein [Chitinophagaceae bacterium]